MYLRKAFTLQVDSFLNLDPLQMICINLQIIDVSLCSESLKKYCRSEFFKIKLQIIYDTVCLLASNNMCLFFQKGDMLNKNTLGIKKVRGQSEAALYIGMCDQKL